MNTRVVRMGVVFRFDRWLMITEGHAHFEHVSSNLNSFPASILAASILAISSRIGLLCTRRLDGGNVLLAAVVDAYSPMLVLKASK